MAIFADLMAAIPAYTGLSPTSFFTIVALIMALYYLVSGFFAAPKHTYVPMEPLPPPVQLGDVTEEELRAYDGSDPSKPLLMAIKGQIYDVSQSRMFYGPGGPYALFAGKDASRALAKMSFEEQDLTGNIEGLSAYEMDALQDWEWKFMSKYVKVGQIPSNVANLKEVAVGDTLSAAQENEAKPRDVPVGDASTAAQENDAKPREVSAGDALTAAQENDAKPGEVPIGDAVSAAQENGNVKKASEDVAHPVVSDETAAAE